MKPSQIKRRENRKEERKLPVKKELRKAGSRFFVHKLDGMTRPSIGYCSYYQPYEVFVYGLIKSGSQDEKIQVEVIGLINDIIS